jgi:hypothetical protein
VPDDGARAALEQKQSDLFEQIGRLQVENPWLMKTALMPLPERIKLVERGSAELSLVRQCEILGINGSSLYYVPRSAAERDCSSYACCTSCTWKPPPEVPDG